MGDMTDYYTENEMPEMLKESDISKSSRMRECRICGEEVPDIATSMLDHLINHPNEYEDIYQRLRDYYNDLED